MVTAGVYMVARLHALYMLAPAVLAIVAITGAATALFAAVIGFAQNDFKKVLAYSTVSQLGFSSWAWAPGTSPAASSTFTRTPSSRRACSCAPARSCTP